MKNTKENQINGTSTKRLIFVLVLLLGVVALSGCISSKKSGSTTTNQGSTGLKATVFKSASCGCCGGYAYELEQNGYQVEKVNTADLSTVKQKYGIPTNMRSCHTTVVGNYFIEGHVPFEAVNKLLTEKPDIDGIALPDMPSGSPGMPGAKTAPFEVYAIKDGQVQGVFMTV